MKEEVMNVKSPSFMVNDKLISLMKSNKTWDVVLPQLGNGEVLANIVKELDTEAANKVKVAVAVAGEKNLMLRQIYWYLPMYCWDKFIDLMGE